jgi:hypothetical protein
MDSCLRRNDTGAFPTPWVSFPRKWESRCFFLDSCLRRNDTGAFPTRGEAYWVPAFAGMTLRGLSRSWGAAF